MSVTKYFVGGEQEAFVSGSHASLGWSTAGGTFDADFARGSVTVADQVNTSYLRIPLTSAQSAFWTSLQHHISNYTSTVWSTSQSGTWISWHNASGTALFRLQGVGGSVVQPQIQFQYWNGSAWVAVTAAAAVCPTDARHKIDVQLTIDNSVGVAAFYLDGVLVNSMSGDTLFGSPSSVSEVRVFTTGYSPTTAYSRTHVSEVQILDVSTLGRRLATLAISTGTTDAWTPSTGADSVSTLDEAGSYSDTDYASSATANQVYTAVTSDLSATAQQYAIDSVVIAYRALRGATGPQNLQGVVRVGGTNYVSGVSVGNLNTVMGYTWDAFDLNPATTAAWTPAQINTAGFETGAKSIT